MVTRLGLCALVLITGLSGLAMPLDRVFDQPTPSYFKRNTERFLVWLPTLRPGLFQGTDLAFLRTCLGKIRSWTVEFDDGTELTSFGWRLPSFADSNDDRFHCLPGEPLLKTAGADDFLRGASISLKGRDRDLWIGIEWDRSSGEWAALVRDPGAGLRRISKRGQTTESRQELALDEALIRSLRFSDPRALSGVTKKSDGTMLLDLAVFNVFWAPDFARELIGRVNDEFGFPVREVEWRDGRWQGLVLP